MAAISEYKKHIFSRRLQNVENVEYIEKFKLMWTYLKVSDKLTRLSRVPRLIFKLIELWWIQGGQNNKQTNLSREI